MEEQQTSTNILNPDQIADFQKQLELKEVTIANLKKVIDQKDELLSATTEKVSELEQKKVEFEEALVNLTNDDSVCGPSSENFAEIDTFVSSTSRAAQLEAEKNDFRVRLATLASHVINFCSEYDEKNGKSEIHVGEAVKRLQEESLKISTEHSGIFICKNCYSFSLKSRLSENFMEIGSNCPYIMVQRISDTLVVLLGKSYFIRRQKCS